MEITEIRVRKVKDAGKLKAYVTITFDSSFVVHNIKVISGHNGDFIAMPSRQTKTGEYKDVAHPITTELRDALQSSILEAYANAQDEPFEDEDRIDV
ncbi:septation regulator SpoVG [Parasphaerochaeta coccoides]|uniref:Putative septation protein SpoVG n=1 Tax=Parasphaerochaeta coccoides (strain ATCC BAA-1237 / DSM 17374 / SPN1) TaxID=760011 RepID=F4GJD4_PARC1|nr:septation regulator SpoVG [Parasphaerochaeta coccoides]AEC02199.1 septation protein spoVG [Parasphaerochaeta coccoides DSM 17374]